MTANVRDNHEIGEDYCFAPLKKEVEKFEFVGHEKYPAVRWIRKLTEGEYHWYNINV